MAQNGNEAGNHGNMGECRIRAPMLVLAVDAHRCRQQDTIQGDGPNAGQYHPEVVTGSVRLWPLTYCWDWCGEFKAWEG